MSATATAAAAPGMAQRTLRIVCFDMDPPDLDDQEVRRSPEPASSRELQIARAPGSERGRYWTTLAMTLTTTARMTAPKRYESSACRTTVRRILRTCTSVSEIWNVIPTVNAT